MNKSRVIDALHRLFYGTRVKQTIAIPKSVFDDLFIELSSMTRFGADGAPTEPSYFLPMHFLNVEIFCETFSPNKRDCQSNNNNEEK